MAAVGDITPSRSLFTSFNESQSSCCTFEHYSGVPSRGGGESAAASALFNRAVGSGGRRWFEDEEEFQTEKEHALMEIQQAVNRYNECFRLLQDALADVEDLHRENLQITAENIDLSYLINSLEKLEKNRAIAETAGLVKDPAVINEYKGATGSGTAVAPRSIAVRSTEFLQAKSSQDGDGRQPRRIRVSSSRETNGREEVSEDEGVEVVVYGQGSWKTELCNKWGLDGRGSCPYGDRCNFAHGMAELRPVIRHPRYKTQLCKMLSLPGGCPYGHRCHFRHTQPSS